MRKGIEEIVEEKKKWGRWDFIVKKAVMDGLTGKTCEQRLEGGEGVSGHVIIWRKSPKRWEKEHVQRLGTWAEQQRCQCFWTKG